MNGIVSYPVAVQRSFGAGYAWAYAPEAGSQLASCQRVLDSIEHLAEGMRIDVTNEGVRLLGEVMADPNCRDELALRRHSKLILIAIARESLTEEERTSLLEGLRSLQVPDVKGPNDRLRISIQRRWRVIRPAGSNPPEPRTLGWLAWILPRPRPGMPSMNDAELIRACQTAEQQLYAVAARDARQFGRQCSRDCLLSHGGADRFIDEPDGRAIDANLHVFDINDRSWSFEVRLFDERVWVAARRDNGRTTEILRHTWRWSSFRKGLLLVASQARQTVPSVNSAQPIDTR